MKQLVDAREAFAETLLELARADKRVCIVLNDAMASTNSRPFLAEFPHRLFDVGIAEQNMVGVAAGLANAGLIPYVCAASCFLTGRALEQVKVDIALSRANVKLCGFSPGFSYGSLGATHHAVEDLAWTRVLPNLKVVAPCDDVETALAVKAAHAYVGPVFIRVNRVLVPRLLPENHVFKFGQSTMVRNGTDVTLVGMGCTTHRALEAASLLDGVGINSRVLNMSTVSPLDVEAIVQAARDTGRIVCVEDHQVEGGLFSAVAGAVVRNAPVPMMSIGVPGVFAPVGDVEDLMREFGLTPELIAARVRTWVMGAQVRAGSKEIHA